jgi:hypothetical protein
MVATPKFVPGENRDPLVTRLAALEKTVAAIANKTLYSASIGAGGITVNGGSIDIEGSGGIKLPVGGTVTDANGVVLLQSDPLGGLAYPWYSVPLLQLFIGPTGPGSTASWPNGASEGFQQAWTTVSSPNGSLVGAPWFAGYLPYVSHPRIYLQTFSAVAASGGTATWGVEITTNGFASFTEIGTWVDSSFTGAFANHTFDLTPYLGETNVGLALKLKSFTGSNGSILMQPYGCFLRGSV